VFNVRAEELNRLKDELQRRRRAILETTRRAKAELEALRGAERDPEFEEGAQAEHEEYTLHRVSEVQQRELQQIDAALSRIEAGEYGVCLDCEIDIDPKRLKAIPHAILCTDCATRRERGLVVESPPSL
jgi:DnaK suppressor protein